MLLRNTSAFVRAIPQDDSRTVEFIISDSTKDRHNTVINTDGWQLDNYMRNPIVGYNHNVYGGGLFSKGTPDDIIGKSEVFKEGNKLIGRVTFEPADLNPTADKIFQKIKFGTLRAASVGFSEIGTGKYGDGEEARGASNETYYFAGQSLMEWSIVNIPSNPSATKRDNYTEPTLNDVLSKFTQLTEQFNEEELRKVSIIDFLKSMEGISELKLPERVVGKKLCDLYQRKLHLISIA